MLNFKRPTREKSYLRGSKNIPWNKAVAVSSNVLPRLVLDAVRQLHAEQVRWFLAGRIERPEKLLLLDRQPIHCVKGAQNVFATAQSEGAQENRAQELTLAVNAHVQHVLLVVFELHPRSAVGNDLAEEVGAVIRRFEEHAR